jgi:pimeloyl-ACP methyl ester carboxylesterase
LTQPLIPSDVKQFPNFLPAAVKELTEATSIYLARSIEQVAITTPLNPEPVITSYVRQGSGGTPILMVHGFDSSVLEYRRLLPLLAEGNETWAVDLLGFGFTERPAKGKLSPVEIKTHLYYFWKSQINQPVILVGASMGGAAALDFTLSYPESVQKLVLIDSAGLAEGSFAAKLMFPPFDYLATGFLRSQKIRQSISRAAYKNKTLASIDARVCAALHLECQNWGQSLIAFTKSGGYTAFRFTKLAEIKQPTLILWGDSDKILGTKDAKRFKRAISNSQLIWIPDSGHVPHLEQPQITAQQILHFVQT